MRRLISNERLNLLDSEVRRLIGEYGKVAVRETLERQCRGPEGGLPNNGNRGKKK